MKTPALALALAAAIFPAMAEAPRFNEPDNRPAILDELRSIYFAVGCRVVDEGSALPLIVSINREYSQMSFGERGYDPAANQRWYNAIGDGRVLARRPGKCEYWGSHPEAARGMRGLVEAFH